MMTLLDAPKYDAARARRRELILYCTAGVLLALFVGWWLVAGRPVDWPWHWNAHLMGRRTANHFLQAVERDDLSTAYGIWLHDKNWQQHQQGSSYTFDRFQRDWSPTSPGNDYGVIKTHKIVAARMYGNVLLMAILVNGAKQNALDLTWDPRTGQLSYAPPGVRLSTVPFSVVP